LRKTAPTYLARTDRKIFKGLSSRSKAKKSPKNRGLALSTSESMNRLPKRLWSKSVFSRKRSPKGKKLDSSKLLTSELKSQVREKANLRNSLQNEYSSTVRDLTLKSRRRMKQEKVSSLLLFSKSKRIKKLEPKSGNKRKLRLKDSGNRSPRFASSLIELSKTVSSKFFTIIKDRISSRKTEVLCRLLGTISPNKEDIEETPELVRDTQTVNRADKTTPEIVRHTKTANNAEKTTLDNPINKRIKWMKKYVAFAKSQINKLHKIKKCRRMKKRVIIEKWIEPRKVPIKHVSQATSTERIMRSVSIQANSISVILERSRSLLDCSQIEDKAQRRRSILRIHTGAREIYKSKIDIKEDSNSVVIDNQLAQCVNNNRSNLEQVDVLSESEEKIDLVNKDDPGIRDDNSSQILVSSFIQDDQNECNSVPLAESLVDSDYICDAITDHILESIVIETFDDELIVKALGSKRTIRPEGEQIREYVDFLFGEINSSVEYQNSIFIALNTPNYPDINSRLILLSPLLSPSADSVILPLSPPVFCLKMYIKLEEKLMLTFYESNYFSDDQIEAMNILHKLIFDSLNESLSSFKVSSLIHPIDSITSLNQTIKLISPPDCAHVIESVRKQVQKWAGYRAGYLPNPKQEILYEDEICDIELLREEANMLILKDLVYLSIIARTANFKKNGNNMMTKYCELSLSCHTAYLKAS